MENDKQSSSGGKVALRFLIKLVGAKGVFFVILILLLIVFVAMIGGVADRVGGEEEFTKIVDSTKNMTDAEIVALFIEIAEGRYPAKPEEKMNWPVPFTRQIISPHGERYDPSVGKPVLHGGIDISAPQIAGKPVVAVADAKIAEVYTDERGVYGKAVELDLGNGSRCFYAQLDKIFVSKGETVWMNQPLGTIADKLSEGGMQPHLHFSLMVNGENVNPLPFFRDVDKIGNAPSNPSGKTNWPIPFTRNIISLYGERVDPLTGKLMFHEGIDISAPEITGKPVVAIENARVKSVDTDASLPNGKSVTIDLGSGILCTYAGLGNISVSVGQALHKDQEIGTVGSASEGMEPHLHFEMTWGGYSVNPLPFLK
jgi:murein DD-endopeptidase MepM/ murein hydrolase activator NlpD